MKHSVKKLLVSLLVIVGICFGPACVASQVVRNSRGIDKYCPRADLVSYIVDWNYDCDAFLLRFSPLRNLLGVLLIDHDNNGFKIEIFNIYTREKIFEFEPITMPIEEFRLNENSVIVNFADAYGTQICYDIYTAGVIWHN